MMSVANAKFMDARSAIGVANQLFMQFYQDKNVENILLEQLDFDEDQSAWLVTIGFDIGRKALRKPSQNALASLMSEELTPIREARRFVIDDETGHLIRMEDA